MPFTTLISTGELARNLENPDWAVFDCRFSLADPDRAQRDYLIAHIPGAIYAHLDRHLSGRVIPGQTGRHPLPDVDDLTRTFSMWGIGPGVQVVAYDDAGGALAASRLWWLLRWLGHDAVAVLDGGFPLWQTESRPVRGGEETRTPRSFHAQLRTDMVAGVSEVEKVRLDPNYRIIDSRTPDRYMGQNETIDPVAGHIPGAVSGPYVANLTPGGSFHPAERLAKRFRSMLGDVPAEQAIFYCGSGATAAHNILALKHAGLGDARLYAGSWSEWITDSERAIAP